MPFSRAVVGNVKEMQIIFRNSKNLKRMDIAVQLLIGIAVLLLAFMIEPLRRPFKEHNPTAGIALGIILVCLWTFKALKETSIKEIKIDENGDLHILVQSHFRGTTVKVLRKQELTINQTAKPDRLRPQNRILRISDQQKIIKISTRQKGIQEKTFEVINKKLKKHYPQQWLKPTLTSRPA